MFAIGERKEVKGGDDPEEVTVSQDRRRRGISDDTYC